MNVPNKLTVTRLILAPFIFFWFYACDLIEGLSPVVYSCVLFTLFLTAEITDWIDGKIARRNGLVTDLGKVMDPFADVICHLTFFVCFMSRSFMPAWCFILIVWREFAQSFLRMLLMGKGKAMPANVFGKAKTSFYALTSLYGFILRCLVCNRITTSWLFTVMIILSIGSAVSSVASFAVYMRDVVKSKVLSTLTR